jgi:hypothetical protein
MAFPKEITKERIEGKVEKIPESGCWIWMGTIQVRGYGQIESNKKKLYAHRASYEAFIGPIPEGLYVCHVCDNVHCVNPSHLFLGTQKQNLEDMARKKRSTLGIRNPRAKLNEENIKGIKTLLNMGWSCASIARLMNVSTGCISLIKRNERWSHVESN